MISIGSELISGNVVFSPGSLISKLVPKSYTTTSLASFQYKHLLCIMAKLYPVHLWIFNLIYILHSVHQSSYSILSDTIPFQAVLLQLSFLHEILRIPNPLFISDLAYAIDFFSFSFSFLQVFTYPYHLLH